MLAASAEPNVVLGGQLGDRPTGTVRVEVLLDTGEGPLLLLTSIEVPPHAKTWRLEVPKDDGMCRVRAGIDTKNDGFGEDDVQAVFPGQVPLDRDQLELNLTFEAI